MTSRICLPTAAKKLFFNNTNFVCAKSGAAFSTSQAMLKIRKLTRMRVVDNSAIGQQALTAGKPAKVFHIYNKTSVGTIGDRVMCAIMGQKKKGYIVGVVSRGGNMVPSFDTNNLVLINDDGSPIGTRITVPIPMLLRSQKGEIAKIMSIATKFV